MATQAVRNPGLYVKNMAPPPVLPTSLALSVPLAPHLEAKDDEFRQQESSLARAAVSAQTAHRLVQEILPEIDACEDTDSLDDTFRVFLTAHMDNRNQFLNALAHSGHQGIKETGGDIQHELSNIQSIYDAETLAAEEEPCLADWKKIAKATATEVDRLIEDYQTILVEKKALTPLELVARLEPSIKYQAKFKGIRVNANFSALQKLRDQKLDISTEEAYTLFRNIMKNAVKYNQPGGLVDIRFGFSQNHSALIMDIQNTGLSIARQEQQSVLQGARGEAAKASGISGTGHGLSRSNQILKKVGGHIHFLEPDFPSPHKEETGTRIQCVIPFQKSQPKQHFNAPIKNLPARQRLSIYV